MSSRLGLINDKISNLLSNARCVRPSGLGATPGELAAVLEEVEPGATVPKADLPADMDTFTPADISAELAVQSAPTWPVEAPAEPTLDQPPASAAEVLSDGAADLSDSSAEEATITPADVTAELAEQSAPTAVDGPSLEDASQQQVCLPAALSRC